MRLTTVRDARGTGLPESASVEHAAIGQEPGPASAPDQAAYEDGIRPQRGTRAEARRDPHALPDQDGGVHPRAAPLPGAERNWVIATRSSTFVAKRLDLPPAHVKGVVTFYTLFNQQPVGKHQVWVCRTLSLRAPRRRRHPRSTARSASASTSGETTQGRQGHAAHGRVPRVLRHRADDAGRQDVPREPHARPRSTRSSIGCSTRALSASHAQADQLPHASSTACPTAGRSPPTSATGGYQRRRKALGDDAATTSSTRRRRRTSAAAAAPASDCGVKWSFMPKATQRSPHYLVINADEGEPGHLQGPHDHGAEPALA